MSKSLVQLVHELFARVDALEKKMAAPVEPVSLRKIDEPIRTHAGTVTVLHEAPAVAAPTRKMCPKCGVKPNYFFHVKTCQGKQKEEQDADTIQRRDQGAP